VDLSQVTLGFLWMAGLQEGDSVVKKSMAGPKVLAPDGQGLIEGFTRERRWTARTSAGKRKRSLFVAGAAGGGKVRPRRA